MDAKQKCTVYGYVRMNYDGDNMIDDIINIIYQFYLIRIASNILTNEEAMAFMNLLFDNLRKQKGNENINTIDTKLGSIGVR